MGRGVVTVHTEARRRNQMSWSWRDRWVVSLLSVLEVDLGN